MATQKIIDYAMRALPYIVTCAQQRRTVTYKELSDHVGCHHHVSAHYLRYIRDEICASRHIPMITAIVVSQNTHMPGINWLPEGTEHLSEEEYREKFEQFRDKVFAFSDWNDLLKELNLTPVKVSMQALKKAGLEQI